MKSKFLSLFRFHTLVVILVFVAYSLLWINWGKLHVYGWDLPALYRKMTKATNVVKFFSAKDSPHLAYFIYIVPILSVLCLLFQFRVKRWAGNLFLFLTCFFGICVSIYMYYYFYSSKIFKMSNAGVGIHLLCLVSIIGLLYLCFKPRKRIQKNSATKEQDNSVAKSDID